MPNLSPFKLHRPVAQAIISSINEILENHRPTDKVLEHCFKNNPKLGKRDRGFIAGQVYDIVRHYILITYCLENKRNPWLVLGAWMKLKEFEVPDWPEFKNLDIDQIKRFYKDSHKTPAIRYSIPKELNEFGKSQLGDRWYTEMRAMHKPAPMILRINSIKANQDQVEAFLNENMIPYHLEAKGGVQAIVVEKHVNLFTSPIYQNGWVEIQDYASQMVGAFVNPTAGSRVIDACAGGGGKSLQMGAMMGNKGRILSLDIDDFKLKNLKKRASRAGADIIETRWIENNKVIKRLESQADKLLLDVPCSGSGVLRRNPDAKYRMTNTYIKDLMLKQAQILDSFCKMVKSGGELIYATCSLFPDENENQVKKFLEKHPEFSFIEETHLWPSEFGYDGFYMARMKKS
ncbi:MAG: RsmB/NOP family class I SAM-dependent RNA methyltransferase [Saprospiraceae bacterium]